MAPILNRLLLVTNTLGRWGETNGVEYTYNNLIPQFSSAGIPVDLIAYGAKNSYEQAGTVNIIEWRPHIPVRYDAELRVDFDPFFRFEKLGKRIANTRYSMVHSATPDTLGLFAWAIARRQRCARISVYHTVVDDFAQHRMEKVLGKYVGKISRKVVWKYLRWYYNKSDLVLAPSNHTKEFLRNNLHAEVEIFARAIDTDKFNPKYRDRGDNKVQILYVGRVAPEKNLDMLIEVEKLLRKYNEQNNGNYPEYYFTIVGDGIYLDTLKQKFPGAHYTGKLTGESLYRAFANGDIFVFPSRTDTFGNVVIQSMSSGLPVVVTDSMGPKEQVVEGKTGFVASTTEQFAQAVHRLLCNHDLRRRMGKAALESARQHSWNGVFRTLLDQYERAYEIHRRIHGRSRSLQQI